ncbi:MAG TPA: acylphosphatase [Casimicrobiaceae bacterium]|nr:acylphosphatase [Casimicrobiaceae bacterium]
MIAYRATIRGRVQGVGYRDAMVDAADALGVCGWVRNRGDGSVEALMQGEDAAVQKLLAWCRRGPPAARVTEIATLVATPEPVLVAFERRPTDWTQPPR